MSDPRISVVIPNYNHGQFLARSLGAMLNQPLMPVEILVVDDASTDNSMDVLRSFTQKHPLIRVHRNEKNLGVCQAMNRGMERTQGEWILFSAADDEVRPGIFKRAAEAVHAHPEAGLCTGPCEWRDPAKGWSWLMGARMPSRSCYLRPADLVDLARRGRLCISGPNAVYRRAALLEVGGWRSDLHWHADWFAAYTIGFRYGICHVPEVLSTFFLYSTSYYHTGRAEQRRVVLNRLLQLLEEDRYGDVRPRVRDSGALGDFGLPMLRAIAAERGHRQFLTVAFLWRVLTRTGEVVGRRFFPDSLARWCLRRFYGGSDRERGPDDS